MKTVKDVRQIDDVMFKPGSRVKDVQGVTLGDVQGKTVQEVIKDRGYCVEDRSEITGTKQEE